MEFKKYPSLSAQHVELAYPRMDGLFLFDFYSPMLIRSMYGLNQPSRRETKSKKQFITNI
jgi:hypothetical protein